MRARAAVVGVLTVLAAGGCVAPKPAPVPPPLPQPPASPAPPDPAATTMEAVHAAAGHVWPGAVRPPRLTPDDELDGLSFEPCDLLIDDTDPPGRNSIFVAADWAGLVQMNPTDRFSDVNGPTTIADIRVAALADKPAAAAATKRAINAQCAPDFEVNFQPAPGRRAGSTVKIGAVDARLVTGTARAAGAGRDAGRPPGEARLTFARGPVVVSIAVVKLHFDGTGEEVTRQARTDAVKLAAEIARALPG
jgi:hypothetical protein